MRDIDRIIERLSADLPGVRFQQLQVLHPGTDDDGLWFIRGPGCEDEVQVESSDGNCPFLIETSCTNERLEGNDVERVVQTVRMLLERGTTGGAHGLGSP